MAQHSALEHQRQQHQARTPQALPAALLQRWSLHRPHPLPRLLLHANKLQARAFASALM